MTVQVVIGTQSYLVERTPIGVDVFTIKTRRGATPLSDTKYLSTIKPGSQNYNKVLRQLLQRSPSNLTLEQAIDRGGVV